MPGRARLGVTMGSIAVIAALLAACYIPVNERPSLTPGPMPSGVRWLGTTRSEGWCRSDPLYTLGVIEIPDAASLWRVFPKMLLAPELNGIDQPMIALVQDPRFPLAVHRPLLPSGASLAPSTEPPSGEVMLCVEMAVEARPVGTPRFPMWYGGVSLEDSPFQSMR